MQGFMKDVDIGGMWRIVGLLALIGSAAMVCMAGYLMYWLYQHLTWV